jgi:zinc transporter 1/2/3
LENKEGRLSVKKEKEKCNLTPFVLMIALSVHSIFEGIAFGLSKDMNSVINLGLSILIHKFAESMSISIAMIKSKMEFSRQFKFIFLFAFATPLGTTIGIILS